MRTSLLALVVGAVLRAQSVGAYTVGTFVGSTLDPARQREIAYTLYFPESFTGTASVLIFSHGGFGSTDGHTRYGHFGTDWASEGYVAIHVNHLPSAALALHPIDRPADVSFVLDQLQAGLLTLPVNFTGSLDVTKFGHSGHSFGAYTSMALSGAVYDGYPDFRDSRIVAAAPVSPQGTGQFGAFDNGAGDNTWAAVDIPMFNLVGEEEKDTNAIGTINVVDWRLMPFAAYSGPGDKFQILLPALDHLEMGPFPTPEADAYIPPNVRTFFDVYLRGDTASACLVGTHPEFAGQELSVKPDPAASVASSCPNFSPVSTPSIGPMGLGFLSVSIMLSGSRAVSSTFAAIPYRLARNLETRAPWRAVGYPPTR